MPLTAQTATNATAQANERRPLWRCREHTLARLDSRGKAVGSIMAAHINVQSRTNSRCRGQAAAAARENRQGEAATKARPAAADALARSLAADADRSAAPDPEAAAFVDVMLGVVALARTFAAVIQAPDPVPTPPPPAPRSREGLLRWDYLAAAAAQYRSLFQTALDWTAFGFQMGSYVVNQAGQLATAYIDLTASIKNAKKLSPYVPIGLSVTTTLLDLGSGITNAVQSA